MSTPETFPSKKAVKDLILRIGVETAQDVIEKDDVLSAIDGSGQRLPLSCQKMSPLSFCFQTHDPLTLSSTQCNPLTADERQVASWQPAEIFLQRASMDHRRVPLRIEVGQPQDARLDGSVHVPGRLIAKGDLWRCHIDGPGHGWHLTQQCLEQGRLSASDRTHDHGEFCRRNIQVDTP